MPHMRMVKLAQVALGIGNNAGETLTTMRLEDD